MRTPLARGVVVLVAILSVFVSSMRVPDAVLGVAFARICAAESARTHHGNPRLRAEREDSEVYDIHALTPRVEAIKVMPRRGREADRKGGSPVDDLRAGASLEQLTVLPLALADADPSIGSFPIDPPTRARTRLMVFLN